MEILPPLVDVTGSHQVIYARHRFAKKRYDSKYKWMPTPKVEAAIIEAIFGRDHL